MKAKVILNPYARRWTALKRLPELESALQSAGIVYEMERTEFPGHGIELASKAVRDGFSPIIAAGGDSTINEVVNGMWEGMGGDELPPLGVFALGTANDFVDNLGLPRSLPDACETIRAGKTSRLDICEVNNRLFVNNSGLGLEPFITKIQMRIHRIQGIARYLLATLIGISKKPEWNMEITWDDGKYTGPVSLVSIGNSPRTGGLFFLTPSANPSDGKLTFLYGSAASRLQLLAMLPKAMRAGKGNVASDQRAYEGHSTRLHIVSQTPTPMHTDGEVHSEDVTELVYTILPGKLSLLTNNRRA